jgi:hypothetical protein
MMFGARQSCLWHGACIFQSQAHGARLANRESGSAERAACREEAMTDLQYTNAVHDTAQSLLDVAAEQGTDVACDAFMLALAEGIAQASADETAIRVTVSKIAGHVMRLATSIRAEMIDEAAHEAALTPSMCSSAK